MKKKIWATALSGILALGLVGCGTTTSGGSSSTSSATTSSDGKKTVNVAITGTVTVIEPFMAPDTNAYPIQSAMYQYLFITENQSSQTLVPVIGKSWEKLDDQTWQIEIYDYVHDVDGNAITVDDVIFSYETVTKAATQTDTAYIDSFEKISDYVFNIKLTEDGASDSNFIKLITHINIVDQQAYEANPDTTPGTTAYKLTSYISGSEFIFEKVDDYWQNDELNAYAYEANVDKIVFQCIPESAQATTALENGEVQMVINMNGLEAKRFDEGGEDDEGFSVDTHSGTFSNVLLFNDTSSSLCNDENLRKAILYAIDRQQVVDIVLSGAGKEAKDIASETLAGFQSSWSDAEYYTYNEEKAKEFLAQSNYSGQTLKLQSSAGNENLLALMQNQLGAIGITVEINCYENALWQTLKVAGTGESDWDICVDGVGGSLITNAWKVKFNPSNFSTNLPQTGSTDEQIVSLLNAAVNSQSESDLNAFHDYIVDHAYAIGLYATASKCATVDTITDIAYDGKGYVIVGASNFDSYGN